MGRIYKRNNAWYLDFHVKGKRIRKRVGTSKHIAELALKDIEVRIVRDEFGFTKVNITIDKLIERFLEYNQTNNRPSTTKRYQAVMDHFRRFLSRKYKDVVHLSQIAEELIEDYKTFRKNEWVNPNGYKIRTEDDITEYTRKGARARTINLEVDGIKTMLNLAVRWGYLKENSLKMVRPLKEDDKKPLRFLTDKECKQFLDATTPKFYPVYFTLLSSGMRKSEIVNLQWCDVDFKRRMILIRSKDDWKPKTGERDIPISNALYDVLEKLKKKNNVTNGSSYVFGLKNSGHSHNILRRELIKTAKRAGIENLTKVHSLRHTFASHLVMNGVDLPTVKNLMGHSDIQTTMIYAHLAPDHLADAVDKLSF